MNIPDATHPDKDPVMGRIYEAVPSFRGSDEYRQMEDYFFDDGDGGPPMTNHYMLMAQLVRHVVTLRLSGDTEPVDRLFTVIEDLVAGADRYWSNVAVIGFLEDLQKTNLHRDGSTPEQFERFLRPQSRWWWDELRIFWAGKLPGTVGSSGRERPEGMVDPMATGERT